MPTSPCLRTVVGIGGGQAVDVAKYFAWRSGANLFQMPTALTVDAAWGHQAVVRRDGVRGEINIKLI